MRGRARCLFWPAIRQCVGDMQAHLGENGLRQVNDGSFVMFPLIFVDQYEVRV
jgi:hypothetical protein